MYGILIGLYAIVHSLVSQSAFSSQTNTTHSIANITTTTVPEQPVPEITSEAITIPTKVVRLSCEAASLQMALESKGIFESQNQLLDLIGVSEPKQSYTKDGVLIWGDPNLGFVGDVQGIFSTKEEGLRGATGWGVNNGPIATVAQMFRPESKAYTGFTAEQIIAELDNHNPVIYWHVPDSYAPGSVTYQTPAGKDITFLRNHVAVISGYKIIDGQTFFMVSDPLYGEYTLTEATLLRRMAKYNGDVVVVR